MPLPDEAAETTLRARDAREDPGTLSARERQVLELRYGLDGQHPRTLDEVGRTFNVTRERIRQIENQSLKKLRALADAVKLPRRRVVVQRALARRGVAPRLAVCAPPWPADDVAYGRHAVTRP